MPDAELRRNAEAGDLHDREILLFHTRRMLKDARIRGLTTEFAGHWLDFRRFEQRLAATDYRFHSVVETIVNCPQFLNKRGRDFDVQE